MPAHIYKRINFSLLLLVIIQTSFINAQPKPARSGITIKQIATLKTTAVRVRRDPASGNLYVLNNDGIIQRVDFNNTGAASLTTLYQTSDHGLTEPLGMTFDKKGNMYLVGNQTSGWELATGVIMRGVRDSAGSEKRTWSRLAQTVQYPYGHLYNHRMSGIIVDTSGKYLYVNSGARTDHGEMEDSLRETGLTAIILKLPINGNSITLQNDREWLKSNGYLFVEGIRNTFDMAYSANGDLFGPDNSDDRDDPDELNWLQEGHHYGFPWRMGGDNTPQQYTPYDPKKDPLLNPATWGGGNLYQTYSNDPAYPPPPAGLIFTEPISNLGPDADKFRDTVTGQVKDASQLGLMVPTFTPHRSPDGIVFDRDSLLAGDLKGGAFVISVANSNLVAALGDTSDDLLHVSLIKAGDNYNAYITRIVAGFNSPLGIEMASNKIYVAETGLEAFNNAPKLWEVTLPSDQSTEVQSISNVPKAFVLHQNYPNPFNPSTTIDYSVPQYGNVKLIVYNMLGVKVRTLVDGEISAGNHDIQWNGKDDNNIPVGSGIYFYQLIAGSYLIDTKKMILLK